MSTTEKEINNPVRKGSFLQENSKSLLFIAGAIVVLIGIYFWYQNVYLKRQGEEASAKMYKAEQYFGAETPWQTKPLTAKVVIPVLKKLRMNMPIPNRQTLPIFILAVSIYVKVNTKKQLKH